MCTFENERAVLVCDVAIGRVKEHVDRELGSSVRYETVDGRGTLLRAADRVEASRFAALIRRGIDEANGADPQAGPLS